LAYGDSPDGMRGARGGVLFMQKEYLQTVDPPWRHEKADVCRHYEQAAAPKVAFVDILSGKAIERRTVQARKNPLTLSLPPFEGSISLRLVASTG
jgi:hypothetical protein